MSLFSLVPDLIGKVVIFVAIECECRLILFHNSNIFLISIPVVRRRNAMAENEELIGRLSEYPKYFEFNRYLIIL